MENKNPRIQDRFNRNRVANLKIKGKLYPLYEGINIIGRNKDAIINIKDVNISHHHALITIIAERHYLSDLNSSNGTSLSTNKLTPFRLYDLPDESVIKFGNTVGVFSLASEDNGVENMEMSQNLTQNFYACETQIMPDITVGNEHSYFSPQAIENAKKEASTQELQNPEENIHDLATQVVSPTDQVIGVEDVEETDFDIHNMPTQVVLDHQPNKVPQVQIASEIDGETIHDLATQVVSLEELQASEATNIIVSSIDQNIIDFHEAETQLVQPLQSQSHLDITDEYFSNDEIIPEEKIVGIHEMETQISHLEIAADSPNLNTSALSETVEALRSETPKITDRSEIEETMYDDSRISASDNSNDSLDFLAIDKSPKKSQSFIKTESPETSHPKEVAEILAEMVQKKLKESVTVVNSSSDETDVEETIPEPKRKPLRRLNSSDFDESKIVNSDSDTDIEELTLPELKLKFDSSSKSVGLSETLNDTDVIPATQDFAPINKNGGSLRETNGGSEESFKLGLTELMAEEVTQNSKENNSPNVKINSPVASTCKNSPRNSPKPSTSESKENSTSCQIQSAIVKESDDDSTQLNEENGCNNEDVYMQATQKIATTETENNLQAPSKKFAFKKKNFGNMSLSKIFVDKTEDAQHNQSADEENDIYLLATQQILNKDNIAQNPNKETENASSPQTPADNSEDDEDNIYNQPTQAFTTPKTKKTQANIPTILEESTDKDFYLLVTQKMVEEKKPSSTPKTDEEIDNDIYNQPTQAFNTSKTPLKTYKRVANQKTSKEPDSVGFSNSPTEVVEKDLQSKVTPSSPIRTSKRIRKPTLKARETTEETEFDVFDQPTQVSSSSNDEGVKSPIRPISPRRTTIQKSKNPETPRRRSRRINSDEYITGKDRQSPVSSMKSTARTIVATITEEATEIDIYNQETQPSSEKTPSDTPQPNSVKNIEADNAYDLPTQQISQENHKTDLEPSLNNADEVEVQMEAMFQTQSDICTPGFDKNRPANPICHILENQQSEISEIPSQQSSTEMDEYNLAPTQPIDEIATSENVTVQKSNKRDLNTIKNVNEETPDRKRFKKSKVEEKKALSSTRASAKLNKQKNSEEEESPMEGQSKVTEKIKRVYGRKAATVNEETAEEKSIELERNEDKPKQEAIEEKLPVESESIKEKPKRMYGRKAAVNKKVKKQSPELEAKGESGRRVYGRKLLTVKKKTEQQLDLESNEEEATKTSTQKTVEKSPMELESTKTKEKPPKLKLSPKITTSEDSDEDIVNNSKIEEYNPNKTAFVNQSLALLEAKTSKTRRTKPTIYNITLSVPKNRRSMTIAPVVIKEAPAVNVKNDRTRRGQKTLNNNSINTTNKDLSKPSTSSIISQEETTLPAKGKSVPKTRGRPKKSAVDNNLKDVRKEKDESGNFEKPAAETKLKQQTIATPKKRNARNTLPAVISDSSGSEISTPTPSKVRRLTTALSNDSFTSSPERSRRKLKPKVVFTMLDSPELECLIRQLGGTVVDSVKSSTVLVTEHVRRSEKLLSAVGQGKPICSPKWIRDSKKGSQFLDPWDFILIDKEAETKWNFSLKESLLKSVNTKLLENYTFQIMVNNAADVLKGAIEASGGKCVARTPGKNSLENFYIVSSAENKSKYSKVLKQNSNVKVIEPEAIFDGVLRQELRFSKHLLS